MKVRFGTTFMGISLLKKLRRLRDRVLLSDPTAMKAYFSSPSKFYTI